MYAWDALIVAFLSFWTIGVLVEVQRSEPLSLSKFMHLPVSVTGAFLINYVSSLLRLSLIVFGPVMMGFAVALVVVKGPVLLPALFSLAAFLLMVSALTYQFQGWLAALMSNPRRRRTIVVGLTAFIVLMGQVPNLWNLVASPRAQRRAWQSSAAAEDVAKREAERQARGHDGQTVPQREQGPMDRQRVAAQQAEREAAEQRENSARLVNMVLPIGWLPIGVVMASDGYVLPSIFGFLGMTLIGMGSLWLSYRATVRVYGGEQTSRSHRPVLPAAAAPPGVGEPATILLEWRLPATSEPVSAVALAGLRALLRSPEAKMGPLMMSIVFGSMLLRSRSVIPELVRPLIAIGAMLNVLLGVMQAMAHQFSFDRDGYRVFVLCPASRRDILLGKNLAIAPVALGLGTILLIVVQVLCPLRLDHFVAMLPQYLSMFLICCVVSNLASILAPVQLRPGSLRASGTKVTTGLVHFVLFVGLFPLSEGLTLLPLGVEAAWRFFGGPANAPTYLVLSTLECALVVLLYRLLLRCQGQLLQSREQRILEIVTRAA
jgi:ABC-2 type transport system permease protein